MTRVMLFRNCYKRFVLAFVFPWMDQAWFCELRRPFTRI